MIKIVAKLRIPQEKQAAFKATAAEIVEKSRAEAGNVFYTLNVSKADPEVMAFVECWKDQAAVDFHNATEHFTTILPKLGAMSTEPASIELFEEIL